jgi:hypothetical protein
MRSPLSTRRLRSHHSIKVTSTPNISSQQDIGRELANWMDDICMPGDHFETKLNNLQKFFTRCHDKTLSLSPSKTKLFFTEVLFTGAMIGPGGIKPNLDKVAAVVNWPEPQDVQDLMVFLGLTNYFRHLINDYARIAAPLTDSDHHRYGYTCGFYHGFYHGYGYRYGSRDPRLTHTRQLYPCLINQVTINRIL